jgi:hypothetical protein
MTTCRWTSSTTPRVVTGRHADECADRFAYLDPDRPTTCAGCLPCPEHHCVVDGKTHVFDSLVCPECLAETRADLREIGRLCNALPAEVEARGINGEAMVLLGPTADPEARGHLEASVLAGRVPADYLEAADDERHPLLVLGTHEMVWRDHIEDPTDRPATVADCVEYLDRHLHRIAAEPLLPFADLARDLSSCRAHLEAVLHDGEQRDTGAPCMTCQTPLERVWGATRDRDEWKCPRCQERSTEAHYWLTVANEYRRNAKWLTDVDCEVLLGVRPGTVREWARRGLVKRHKSEGRMVYDVAQVRQQMERAGMEETA